jgi:exopolysaccharide biosynthesis WecB/TagA/CpsF family protein
VQASKRNVVGVLVDAVSYDDVVRMVVSAAERQAPLAVTALAVHGVMTGVLDPEQRYRLNSLDLVVPDGQPVRWALNLLHGSRLRDRVYGPTLMLRTCEAAAERGLPIYLYGSRPEVLRELAHRLTDRFPRLAIAGAEPSRFRPLRPEEKAEVVERIRSSGARVVFVGLGCPRQEVWAYEYRDALSLPVLAVGAAFDFHAGLLKQAPPRLQRLGLEWAYRLYREPRRLWARYAYLNPLYLAHVALQAARIRRYDVASGVRPTTELGYG